MKGSTTKDIMKYDSGISYLVGKGEILLLERIAFSYGFERVERSKILCYI